MNYFGGLPGVAATCCPAGRLTPGYLCRAPVGGFWFGAGRPRPAKGEGGDRGQRSEAEDLEKPPSQSFGAPGRCARES